MCTELSCVIECVNVLMCSMYIFNMNCFYTHAYMQEIDVDSVACDGEIIVMAISEHVENAGTMGLARQIHILYMYIHVLKCYM